MDALDMNVFSFEVIDLNDLKSLTPMNIKPSGCNGNNGSCGSECGCGGDNGNCGK